MIKNFLSLCAFTILSISAFTSCGGGMETPEGGGGGVTPPAVVPVTSITLSATTIQLWNGSSATRLTATVLPANATDKTITWTNSHPEFATFDPTTGILTKTETGFGITTITATANGATKVDATAGTCTVKVTDYPNTAARDVPLMAGGTVVGNIEWAPVNCGTDETHPMGRYYQWGRREGFTYVEPVGGNNQLVSPGVLGPKPEADAFGTLASTFIYTYGGTGKSTYNWLDVGDNSPNNTYWTPTPTEPGGPQNPCPEGWRVPTRAEMETLRTYKQTDVVQTGQQPTSADVCDIYGQNMGANYAYGNDVPGSTVGMWFGNADQTVQTTQDVNIYLPAAGMINGSNGGYCLDKGIKGYYWTATPSSDSGIDVDFAVFLHFSASADDVKNLNNQGRAYGFSIRCVRSI